VLYVPPPKVDYAEKLENRFMKLYDDFKAWTANRSVRPPPLDPLLWMLRKTWGVESTLKVQNTNMFLLGVYPYIW
jgi:hypothetical protein